MNPPERFSPPAPRRISWREALQQAPLPPIPADFAARLQARVVPSPAPTRGETLLMQVLITLLIVGGLVLSLPELGAGFSALLQQFGDMLPAAVAIGCALSVAWGVDLLAGRAAWLHR